MASLAPDLVSVIRRSCDELARTGIRCERVMLFGSQAEGTAREGSDVDLLIISRDWAPYGLRERPPRAFWSPYGRMQLPPRRSPPAS